VFPARYNPRSRERENIPYSRGFQRHCAAFQCRACRTDVVDQHNISSFQFHRSAKPPAPQGESSLHIGVPAVGRQLDLWPGLTRSNQRLDDRQAAVSRKLTRLIETTLPFAATMERDGRDAVGVLENVTTARAHQRRKRSSQRSSTAVLEGMDDLAEGSVVLADRSRSFDHPLAAAASTA
jgi:hypothetical protein